MRCPACRSGQMELCDLEEGLSATQCRKCGGHWITYPNYERWLAKHGPTLPERDLPSSVAVAEDQQARLCPGCHVIMIRYKVGHGLRFFLDRCNSCDAVWLDANEWEALKEKNLHDEMHRVFSPAWQDAERKKEARQVLTAVFRERFGDDYQRLVDLRAWIERHPERDAILAFLHGQEGDHTS